VTTGYVILAVKGVSYKEIAADQVSKNNLKEKIKKKKDANKF